VEYEDSDDLGWKAIVSCPEGLDTKETAK